MHPAGNTAFFFTPLNYASKTIQANNEREEKFVPTKLDMLHSTVVTFFFYIKKRKG